MIVAFDSLKFYKLKNENTVKILFFILYAAILLSYILPIGQPIEIDSLLEASSKDPSELVGIVSFDNLIYYSFSIFLLLFTSFISLIYATSYVMESENFPNKKAVRDTFLKIPQLILFVLLLIPPIFISSLFLFIPLIYIYYSLFLTPLLITEGKRSLVEAIIESFKLTRGFKFSIFFAQITLYFVMNIPISLFSISFEYTGYQNTFAEHLVISFLRAIYILMTGRLLGNFYILLLKNRDKIKKIEIEFIKHNKSKENEDQSEEEDEDN